MAARAWKFSRLLAAERVVSGSCLRTELRMATNVPWAACEKLALEEFLGWTLGGHGAKPLKHEALLVDPADQ